MTKLPENFRLLSPKQRRTRKKSKKILSNFFGRLTFSRKNGDIKDFSSCKKDRVFARFLETFWINLQTKLSLPGTWLIIHKFLTTLT